MEPLPSYRHADDALFLARRFKRRSKPALMVETCQSCCTPLNLPASAPTYHGLHTLSVEVVGELVEQALVGDNCSTIVSIAGPTTALRQVFLHQHRHTHHALASDTIMHIYIIDCVMYVRCISNCSSASVFNLMLAHLQYF